MAGLIWFSLGVALAALLIRWSLPWRWLPIFLFCLGGLCYGQTPVVPGNYLVITYAQFSDLHDPISSYNSVISKCRDLLGIYGTVGVGPYAGFMSAPLSMGSYGYTNITVPVVDFGSYYLGNFVLARWDDLYYNNGAVWSRIADDPLEHKTVYVQLVKNSDCVYIWDDVGGSGKVYYGGARVGGYPYFFSLAQPLGEVPEKIADMLGWHDCLSASSIGQVGITAYVSTYNVNIKPSTLPWFPPDVPTSQPTTQSTGGWFDDFNREMLSEEDGTIRRMITEPTSRPTRPETDFISELVDWAYIPDDSEVGRLMSFICSGLGAGDLTGIHIGGLRLFGGFGGVDGEVNLFDEVILCWVGWRDGGLHSLWVILRRIGTGLLVWNFGVALFGNLLWALGWKESYLVVRQWGLFSRSRSDVDRDEQKYGIDTSDLDKVERKVR